MRVLFCPDSFTGTLTAAEAAAAMAQGWRRAAPTDELISRPLSDGGPGFVEAVHAGRGAAIVRVEVAGPLGQPVTAQYLLDPEGTAWIESASAAGLHLIPGDLRDPTRTTSLGVGQLIGDALTRGAGRIVVGVGGTGTCDGGAGLLSGLGAQAVPGELTSGGGALVGLTELDLGPALDRLGDTALEVATDVDVPLLGSRGAAHGFAAQKGATPAQVDQLEQAMTHWVHLMGRRADGRAPGVALGAGAGGGIGAALLRLGGRRVPGIATVLAASGVADLLSRVDLVVTGEGAFDWQSLRGKVVAGVAAAALENARPTVVLAGRIEVSRREWIGAGIAAVFATAPTPGQSPADAVADAAARAARTWSRP